MKQWISTPLFDFAEQQYADRKAGQERSYEAATDEWRDAVYDFAARVFLPGRTEGFIFEELSRAYEEYAKTNGKPTNDSKRAYAGVQQRLKKEGLIKVIDGAFGRSYEGNLRPMYAGIVRNTQ